jgi:HEAT repeat protein
MAAALFCALPFPLAQAAPTAAAPDPLTLGKEIAQAARPSSFEPTLVAWQKRYGRQGVLPLLDYAESAAHPDAERYVALMGATRLGGQGIAHRITPFLKSSSWLLRSGALRALRELKDPATARETLPLLKDPALAVRIEAVASVQVLKPAGATTALLETLGSAENYQKGRALWVPGRALAALSVIRAPGTAPKLLPLLDHSQDPVLQIQTVATLESLTGRKLKAGAPLKERVREWKLALMKERAARAQPPSPPGKAAKR